MIKKKNNQISFAQLQVSRCIDKTHWLYKVNKIIDWRPVQEKLLRLYPSNVGRPAYDPVFMFKILLLQQWFNLSDALLKRRVPNPRFLSGMISI